MYPDQIQANRRKALVAVVVLAVVGLVIYTIFTMISNKNKVAINFRTAPSQVTIKMNGTVVGKNAHVAPGTYTVTAEREGFATFSQQVTVSKDSVTDDYPIALTPQTDAAREIANREARIYSELEDLGGKKAQQEGVKFNQENPIARYVPYKTGYYAIDYGRDEANNFVVQITASSPLGRKVAIEKIREWGFEPTNLRIQFLGFSNQLAADAKKNGAIQ